jgi:hypothetical protein
MRPGTKEKSIELHIYQSPGSGKTAETIIDIMLFIPTEAFGNVYQGLSCELLVAIQPGFDIWSDLMTVNGTL